MEVRQINYDIPNRHLRHIEY